MEEEQQFYLISEEELIALLQTQKNMQICLKHNLINKVNFCDYFNKWLVEERKITGLLNENLIKEQYDEWTKDFIGRHYYSFILGDEEEEEEIDPMKLN
jgi:hypothetical protein